ncbi:MAG: hypothetical protein HQ472_02805 [Ignavibacteria bacterium]|nr:hypothetical protein [Ignavibacteria bacterium]
MDHQRYTEDEKRIILNEVEVHGLGVTVCNHGVTAKTVYRWRIRMQGMVQQLKEIVADWMNF